MITKVLKYTVLSLCLTMAISSCDDLLEPALENLKDLDEIQKESTSVKNFLNNAYILLPGYYSDSDYATDDAVTNQKDNALLKIATGGWTADNGSLSAWAGSYAAIQYVELFMATKDGQKYVANESTNALLTERLLGEAYGLRGIHLYYLLRAHAGKADGQLLGIQLFDGVLSTNSNFNLERSSFKDCVDRAINDLDQAIAHLPQVYENVATAEEIPAKYKSITNDPAIYNRVMGVEARKSFLVNARIAQAFRSRLLLLAASPAYQDGSNSEEKWKAAANAAAELIDDLGGVAALPNDGLTYYTGGNVDENLLKDGGNPKEIIWRSSQSTNASAEEANYPPSLFGNGRMSPTDNLVRAFPAANGYPITDTRSGYSDEAPYINRDPRLSTYIVCDKSTEGPTGAVIRTGGQAGNDGIDKIESRSTRTGYYMRKRLNMDVSFDNGSGKWNTKNHYDPRIRVTEIFLNYAEAANEAYGPKGTGTHGYSAYDIIKKIRQRAGITDTGYLDECAANADDMRKLIRNERRLELCFEGFRFWDLRRWMSNLNEAATGLDVNEDAQGNFTFVPFKVEDRAYKDYMIYGPIPHSEVLKYNNLKQNDGWQ